MRLKIICNQPDGKFAFSGSNIQIIDLDRPEDKNPLGMVRSLAFTASVDEVSKAVIEVYPQDIEFEITGEPRILEVIGEPDLRAFKDQ